MIKKEDGSISVFIAFLLVAIFSIIALSVDRGTWLTEKRKYQNAVDSGALTAATEIIKNGEDESEAFDAVLAAMRKNVDINLSTDTVDISRDGGNITVTLSKNAKNYFGTTVNGKKSTKITVSATAGTEQKITTHKKKKVDLPINAAIEAGGNFNWTGNEDGPIITGDITVGGGVTITSPVSMNGSVSSDDNMVIKPNGTMIINGSLYSGGTTQVTTPVTVNGNIESTGNITWNTSGGKVAGNVSSNGDTFLGAAKVDGSVESVGKITFNESGAAIGGDVRSNTQTYINGGAQVTVDGTFYQKGDILDYQKTNTTTSSGNSAKFVDDTGKQAVGTVSHNGYVWRWDKLYEVKNDSLEITKELYNAYVNDKCDGLSYKACIQYAFGRLEFQAGSDLQGFLDYCHEKAGVDKSIPSYFNGDIYFNMGAVDVYYNGCIITEGDLVMNSQMHIRGTGACLMSMNGNITVGNWGKGTTLDGAVIVMNASKSLTMNNGGSIHGGIICHGNISMTGAWTINASDNWQSSIPVIDDSGEIEDLVTTNIRLVK